MLEAGSVQFSAWLPVLFVPALVPWVRAPGRVSLAEILGSSGSLAEAVVAAAKSAARRAAATAAWDCMYEDRLSSPSPTGAPAKTGPGGSGFRLAVNVASLLLSVAGGWLVSFRSAAAVVPALSLSSSLTTVAATAAAATSSSGAASVTTADVRSFGQSFVRRLGVGMVTSGLISVASSVTMHRVSPWLNARVKKSLPLWNKAFENKLSSPEGRSEIEVALAPYILFTWTSYTGACLSAGLTTLFGFAAGHASVQPGGLFSRSSAPPCAPWKVALVPVVASAAATAVSAATLNLASGCFLQYVSDDE